MEAELTDAEIETQRIAGEISLRLEHGTDEEKASLLRLIEHCSGRKKRDEVAASYGIEFL